MTLETGENIFGMSELRVWIFLRGIAGATSLFFRYSALRYMSLADVTIIVLSMPVFVFIFARIFLKEDFGRFHVLAVILSTIGILFASKIELLFGSETPQSVGSSSSPPTAGRLTANGVHERLIGILFSVGAMLVSSFVYVLVRKVSTPIPCEHLANQLALFQIRSTHHSIILFNFSLVAILEMVTIEFGQAIWSDQGNVDKILTLPLEGYTPWLMCLLAVLSFYGQILLTKAIQLEEAGVISVVRASGEVSVQWFPFIRVHHVFVGVLCFLLRDTHLQNNA